MGTARGSGITRGQLELLDQNLPGDFPGHAGGCHRAELWPVGKCDLAGVPVPAAASQPPKSFVWTCWAVSSTLRFRFTPNVSPASWKAVRHGEPRCHPAPSQHRSAATDPCRGEGSVPFVGYFFFLLKKQHRILQPSGAAPGAGGLSGMRLERRKILIPCQARTIPFQVHTGR